MPIWPVCLLLCATLGCGARSPPPPKAVGAHATGKAAPATPAPVELRRQFTGQAQPSLVVENHLPITQHVFIDWTQRATLAPATSRRFELKPGTHTVTCSDSIEPDDQPAAVTEGFEAGYAYVYALRAGG